MVKCAHSLESRIFHRTHSFTHTGPSRAEARISAFCSVSHTFRKPAELPSISLMPVSNNGRLEEAENAPPMDASRSCGILREPVDAHIDGMLDIILHHASDIHNICIYGNQDVYAKFSITQAQDAVYSTQPVRGGGKNPVFNQSLQILISNPDSVLKCELWMMSCARNYLQDQLLGFSLVHLHDLLGMGKLTRNYSLTSTELFHTPAGTVCLSLSFYKRSAQPLLDMVISKVSNLRESENGDCLHLNTIGNDNNRETMIGGTPIDYNSIEFPDLQSEDQQLVSVYITLASDDSKMKDIARARFDTQEQCNASGDTPEYAWEQDGLKDGAQEHLHVRGYDLSLNWGGHSEMVLNNREQEDNEVGSDSRVFPSYRMGMMIDATLQSTCKHAVEENACKEEIRNTMKGKCFNSTTSTTSYIAAMSPTSAASSVELSSSGDKVMGLLDGQESASSSTNHSFPMSISLDPEVPVVQQQIVAMYMESMEQFTESLAKMKLPFNGDSIRQSSTEHTSESQQSQKSIIVSEPDMKDGHRVFYGSRAFF